jgi:hypothetical protein
VQVLEDEDERALLSKRLEETAPGREGLLAGAADRLVASETDERAELPCDPRPLGLLDVLRDRLAKFPGDVLRGVALEDSRLRLHHLSERPERGSFAVRQRPPVPPEDELLERVHMCEQFCDEAALADAGNTGERHLLRRSLLAGPLERIDELIQLSAAADQRRAGRDGFAADARARRHGLPDADRLGLPLCLDRLGVAIVDHVPGRPVGRLADEDPVHGRGRLQARCRVHDVPRRHPFTPGGPCAQRDQGLARVDGDPQLQLRLFFDDPVADRKRRTHCALRIVFVCDRGAEQRHHGIADELLHGASETFELHTEACVVRGEERAHVLRVELLGARGEADQVGEEHRDDLPLLAPGRLERERRAT